MESGSRSGTAPNTPLSYTSSRSGVTVRLARLHAMFGGPTPTKQTRSPASWRDDATIIISAGVYSAPIASPFLDQHHADLSIRKPIVKPAGRSVSAARVKHDHGASNLTAPQFDLLHQSPADASASDPRGHRELLDV